MNRRFIKAGRRNIRGGNNSSLTPGSILGADVSEYWDSRIAASSTTWTGVKQQIAMAGSGATKPPLAADGTNFNGLNVFGFNGTDQAFDTGTLSVILAPVNSLPYMWLVGRIAALPGGAVRRMLATCRTPGIETELGFGDFTGVGTCGGVYTGNIVVGALAAQAAPSFWEVCYNTATGVRELWRNGTLVASGAAAAGITNAIQRVFVGGFADLSNSYIQGFVSQLGVCPAVPSDAKRAALLGLSRADWGTP